MENSSNSEARQADDTYSLPSGQNFRHIQLEHVVRKAWANSWARNAKEGAIAAEVLRFVQTAFPDMSQTEVSAAIERLRKPAVSD